MNKSQSLGTILFILSLGCVHVTRFNNTGVDVGKGVVLHLPDPRQILPPVQLVQLFKISYNSKNYSNQMILTSQNNKISVVSLLPFGGELFRIVYDGQDIQYNSLPGVSSGFDVKYALADLVLIYGEADKIESWSNGLVKIIDKGLERDVYFESENLIKIKYSGSDRLRSQIEYRHFVRGYVINIEFISAKVL